jgi:hypothetical protein
MSGPQMLSAISAGLALAACAPVLPVGQRIVGPYYLVREGAASFAAICYQAGTSPCLSRIGPDIFAYGWNDHFVVAGRHPYGDRTKEEFYYVVRLRDGASAEYDLVVKGPFDRDALQRHMRDHGVPPLTIVIPKPAPPPPPKPT